MTDQPTTVAGYVIKSLYSGMPSPMVQAREIHEAVPKLFPGMELVMYEDTKFLNKTLPYRANGRFLWQDMWTHAGIVVWSLDVLFSNLREVVDTLKLFHEKKRRIVALSYGGGVLDTGDALGKQAYWHMQTLANALGRITYRVKADWYPEYAASHASRQIKPPPSCPNCGAVFKKRKTPGKKSKYKELPYGGRSVGGKAGAGAEPQDGSDVVQGDAVGDAIDREGCGEREQVHLGGLGDEGGGGSA